MLTLTEHYDRIAAEQGHTRSPRSRSPGSGAGSRRGRVRGAARADARGRARGHDITAMFAEATAWRGFSDAQRDLQGDVVAARGARRATHPGALPRAGHRRAAHVRPAWEQLAEQHHARAAHDRGRVGALPGDGRRVRRRSAPRRSGSRSRPSRRRGRSSGSGRCPTRPPIPPGTPNGCVGPGRSRPTGSGAASPRSRSASGRLRRPAQQLAHELWLRAAETGSGDPRVDGLAQGQRRRAARSAGPAGSASSRTARYRLPTNAAKRSRSPTTPPTRPPSGAPSWR